MQPCRIALIFTIFAALWLAPLVATAGEPAPKPKPEPKPKPTFTRYVHVGGEALAG